MLQKPQENISTTGVSELSLAVVDASGHPKRTVIYVRQSTWHQVGGTSSRPAASTSWSTGPAAGLAAGGDPVIDGDLGSSGSVTGQRDGFEGMVAEVALGQAGIILALEVSRLARDNAAWYRLLDLAGVSTRWSPTLTASTIRVVQRPASWA